VNFPSDAEMREFTAYSTRARGIVVEEFKQQEGRPPNELELQDFLKMVVVPFGILKQQNGSSHFLTPQIPAQTQARPPEKKPKTESVANSVLALVKGHSELSIEGERIVMKKKIEPVDVFFAVRDELERRGKYIRPKNTGGDKWEPEFFEVNEARS